MRVSARAAMLVVLGATTVLLTIGLVTAVYAEGLDLTQSGTAGTINGTVFEAVQPTLPGDGPLDVRVCSRSRPTSGIARSPCATSRRASRPRS